MTRATEPTAELVTACARTEFDQSKRRRIDRLLERDVDWDDVLEMARRDGVTPLLHRALSGRDDRVPDDVLETLRGRLRSTATHNLLAADELTTIVADLEAAGVPALSFKGPALAVAAYDDLGLREFVDLDLLVPKDDLPRAVDLLESMGYSWFDGTPRLDDAAVLGGPFTPPIVPEFRLQRGGQFVELRHQVGERTYPVDLDFESLWSRRESVELAGTAVPSLDEEDRHLVLAYHGSKHCWARLKWVCDVAETVRAADGVDWQRLLERAADVGARRRLLVSLEVAAVLLDADVPEWVREEASADRRACRLVEQTVERRRELLESGRGDSPRLWYNVLASDSLRDATATVVHAPWFKPGIDEYRLKPLPGQLHPLYYPVRPFRGLASTVAQALRE